MGLHLGPLQRLRILKIILKNRESRELFAQLYMVKLLIRLHILKPDVLKTPRPPAIAMAIIKFIVLITHERVNINDMIHDNPYRGSFCRINPSDDLSSEETATEVLMALVEDGNIIRPGWYYHHDKTEKNGNVHIFFLAVEPQEEQQPVELEITYGQTLPQE